MEVLYLVSILICAVAFYLLIPKRKKATRRETAGPEQIRETEESVSFFFSAGETRISEDENSFRILKTWKGSDRRIAITGWTDDTGTPASNRRLAQERALKTKRFLEERVGIPSERILVSFPGVDPESIGNPNKFRFRRADCLLVPVQEESQS